MQIINYHINQCHRRQSKWCEISIQALLQELPLGISSIAAREANEEHRNILCMGNSSEEIGAAQFNLIAISDHDLLVRYRFKRIGVGRTSNMINFDEVTDPNGYTCDQMTSTCIFLNRRGTRVRWNELESIYGMFESQLSETFWDIATAVYEKFEYKMRLRTQLMQQRAHIYGHAIDVQV